MNTMHTLETTPTIHIWTKVQKIYLTDMTCYRIWALLRLCKLGPCKFFIFLHFEVVLLFEIILIVQKIYSTNMICYRICICTTRKISNASGHQKLLLFFPSYQSPDLLGSWLWHLSWETYLAPIYNVFWPILGHF